MAGSLEELRQEIKDSRKEYPTVKFSLDIEIKILGARSYNEWSLDDVEEEYLNSDKFEKYIKQEIIKRTGEFVILTAVLPGRERIPLQTHLMIKVKEKE